VDSDLPIGDMQPIKLLINSSILEQIVLARLGALFGVAALALSCIGLYGIMSYTMASRTREIGLRVALGAQRSQILWLAIRESLVLLAAGILIGIPAALAGSRFVSSMLVGVQAADPMSLVTVILIFGVVATLASYLPARRAAGVDPQVALRSE